MNRSNLRFLGMKHDAIRHDNGTQEERDRLLAQIDALAQPAIRPKVGSRYMLRRVRKTCDLTFAIEVEKVYPGDGFVFVEWRSQPDGRFGRSELGHSTPPPYRDELVAEVA